MILSMAHRGASGYAPENTEIAIKKALDIDSDMIELDIHMTKDKELVLSHNRKIWNRYAYIDIHKTNLPTLKKVKLKKSQRILRLQDALNIINKGAIVNLDIKSKNSYKMVNNIIRDYIHNKKWKYNDFIVSSLMKDDLLELKQLNPRIRIGLIYFRKPKNLNKIIEMYKPYSFHIHFMGVNKNFVKFLHEKGIKIFVWTVNSRKLIDKLRGYNVDGICSDYPDRI